MTCLSLLFSFLLGFFDIFEVTKTEFVTDRLLWRAIGRKRRIPREMG